MKILVKKSLNIFIFSFLSFISLYLSYGLLLKYFTTYSNFLQYVLYFVFIVGFILSIFFNKSKVFLMLLLLLLLYIFAGSIYFNFTNRSSAFLFLFIVFIFIISFNIIIFSFYRERGIFTSWGLKRASFITLQIYILYLISKNDVLFKELLNFLNADLFRIEFLTDYFPISNQLLLIWYFSFLIVLISLNRAEDYAFLFIIIHLFVLLFYLKSSGGVFILKFTLMSALILDIATIKDFYSMAYLDELTGLPGRRALREELLKLGNNYSIAMLDIDFFKKFNDKYGHDIGDQVLKMVAAMMKKTKGGAKVFRYGGEEFTIVYSSKGVEEVSVYLDELRENIANRPFTIRSKKRPKDKSKKDIKDKSIAGTEKVKITVSIGVAEKKSSHENANQVIKEADNALYKAKKKGRNCVIY